MAYTDDWRALQAQIVNQRSARTVALDTSYAATAHMLAEVATRRTMQAQVASAVRAVARADLARHVAEQMIVLRDARQLDATEQRAARYAAAEQQRCATARLLQLFATQRSAQANDQHQQRSSAVDALRQATAAQLADLGVALDARAIAQRQQLDAVRSSLAQQTSAWLAETRAGLPALYRPAFATPADAGAVLHDLPLIVPVLPDTSAPPAQPAEIIETQSFNQAGIYAYAKLARVAILKALDTEGTALGVEQREHLSAYVAGIRRNVEPFLNMLSAVQSTLDDEQRQTMFSCVEDLQHNVGALATELSAVVDTRPAPHHPDGTYIAALYADVAQLLSAIASVGRSLVEPVAPHVPAPQTPAPARRRQARGDGSKEAR
ncbi:MAG: hypothetical protein H7Z42_14360 [Roseiflexaceae bacterium]|nr:hypothetical protein [Roseiflexaceae bacterium]